MIVNKIKKLQNEIKKLNLSAVLITNPANVYYYSSFMPLQYKLVQPMTDPECFLFITKKETFLLADSRYAEAAKKYKDFKFEEIPYPANPANIAILITKLAPKIEKLGIEFDSILYSDLITLEKEITSQIVDVSECVANLRIIKDETEIKLLEKAATITAKGFEFALSKIKKGITEKQLAFEITSYFLKNADGNSFPPIVAFGEGSSIPHYETSNKKINGTGILLIDLGCVYKGYCGDMTRTVYIGKATEEFKNRYTLVLQSQLAAIDQIRTGMTGKMADNIARRNLSANGYGDYFTHGTGHGIGLAIHEAPSLRITSKDKLQNGMVFSVEPGIYVPKWGGIRIEDVCYLKNDKLINITNCDKKLREIKI